jgi:UDP-N-acetylglucosamine transferase subunit ALG13
MIFLTVGTYPIPFDRLVRAIDIAIVKGLIEEEVFAQIGLCEYRPQNIEYVEILEQGVFDSYFRKAAGIISHAGIGTITMALEYSKPILVMPRRKRFKEHVNDHQVATARKFEEFGHILVAYDAKDLPDGICQLKNFIPRRREANPHAVADRIGCFLKSLNEFR